MTMAHPLSSYPGEGNGGDASDASSISFGMSYGAADPAVAYDDPALWCHPSAPPESVVVPSQLSTFSILQAHHVPSHHGHAFHYAAEEDYQNGSVFRHRLSISFADRHNCRRSYHEQQPGPVHLTTSCGVPTTYHTRQNITLDGSTHVSTNATVSAPSETLFGSRPDVSSLVVVSL